MSLNTRFSPLSLGVYIYIFKTLHVSCAVPGDIPPIILELLNDRGPLNGLSR